MVVFLDLLLLAILLKSAFSRGLLARFFSNITVGMPKGQKTDFLPFDHKGKLLRCHPLFARLLIHISGEAF